MVGRQVGGSPLSSGGVDWTMIGAGGQLSPGGRERLLCRSVTLGLMTKLVQTTRDSPPWIPITRRQRWSANDELAPRSHLTNRTVRQFASVCSGSCHWRPKRSTPGIWQGIRQETLRGWSQALGIDGVPDLKRAFSGSFGPNSWQENLRSWRVSHQRRWSDRLSRSSTAGPLLD